MTVHVQLFASVDGEVRCVTDREYHPGVRLVPAIDGVAIDRCVVDHVLVSDGAICVRDDTLAGRTLCFAEHIQITDLGDADDFFAAALGWTMT